MDKIQKVITRTFTQKQLREMPLEDLNVLLGTPGMRLKGTAIVRKADGTVRCDEGVDPSQFEGA